MCEVRKFISFNTLDSKRKLVSFPIVSRSLKAERIQNKENEKKGTQNYAGLRRFVEFQRNLVQKLYLLMCIRKISETNAGVCSG